MMKRVLIFGAEGFVGFYLAKEFQAFSYEVYGTDIIEDSNNRYLNRYVRCNIVKPEEVESILKELKPDIIVNLAAISSVSTSWEKPQLTFQVNLLGTLNILEAASGLKKVPKILLIGSGEEYEGSLHPLDENAAIDAGNPYGISKTAQEQLAAIYRKKYCMEIFCVRAFNHTGVGQKTAFVLPSFCKQAADIEVSGRDGCIKTGNLHIKRDFTDVRDVVRAYRLIIERGNADRIYNIGSGHAYSLMELLNFIISLSSNKIEINTDTNRIRSVDIPVLYCNNTRIRQELGWKAEHDIYDTLREMFIDFCIQAKDNK